MKRLEYNPDLKRWVRNFTSSELKRRHSEDAYHQAHDQAKLAGKSGEEAHAAGVEAQNEMTKHPIQRKFAFRTQDYSLT